MPSVTLTDRAVLSVTGADAETFLQALITTDVKTLGANDARPGALLTPQGKILFDFMITRQADGFRIETASAQRDALAKRLLLYKLRAAVTFQTENPSAVTVTWDDGNEDGYRDSRFGKAGVSLYRHYGQAVGTDEAAYHALRVRHGIVESPFDYALQDAFPHDVLLDLNDGLSFRKGCYVGQEVVSRMQHRGTARRRVVQVTGDAALPAPGTDITVNGRSIGTLGGTSGRDGVAILRLDKVADAMAAGQAIQAGETTLTVTLPAWSGLSFPATELATGQETPA